MTRLFASAALVAILATPAAAQQAGTYTGTSADGQNVYVIVGTDPYTNAPAIVGAGIYFNAACKGHSGTVLSSAWGYNPNTDLVGNQVTVNYDIPYIASSFTLTFNTNTNTATGTITTAAPNMYPAGVRPTKALYCLSKKQPLSLSYSGMAKAPAMRPGAFTPLGAR